MLPKPPKTGPKFEWHPVVRVGRTVPFGYRQDPDDENLLLPIPDQLDKLEVAKEHLKGYSYREVAKWLSDQTGREISHVGLMKRVKLEKRRRSQAAIQAELIRKYEAAIKTAEKLSKSIGGKETRTEISGDTKA